MNESLRLSQQALIWGESVSCKNVELNSQGYAQQHNGEKIWQTFN